MSATRIAAAFVASLSCPLLTASCIQGPGATVELGAPVENHVTPLIFTCRDECDQEAERAWARCRQLPRERSRQCWQDANNAYAECLKRCKD